jgi:3-oxo-5-alpha-steroid 4-dehydrogenase 1
MSLATFDTLLYVWIAIAVLLIPVQLRITAPYGRHANRNWGPVIDNRLGWMLMEIVSPLCLLYYFILGEQPKTTATWIFVVLWLLHYANRSLIFPWRTRTSGKTIPVAIVLGAVFFNAVNGSTNGYYLGTLADYSDTWLTDPRFLIGGALFIIGAGINLWADEQLLHLRKPGETGYKIPKGGLFNYISCPNHFGEMIQWTGFAIMCWNLPALAFAIWTAANLIPRSLSHHKWYRAHFQEYPDSKKAVVPGVL